MFPIRRPCADAVRTGIVLWSSSSTAFYSNSGLYTRRIFIKQFQWSSRSLFTSGCSFNDNQLTNNSHQISSSPPALNTVLRGSNTLSSSAAPAPAPAVTTTTSSGPGGGAGNRSQQLEEVEVIDGKLNGQIKYAATPKGKERVVESEPADKKKNHKEGGAGASSGGDAGDKPSLDKLQKTYNVLQKSLERTFTHAMDYSIYHPEIVFIDNIRHIRTQGLAKYIQQVALLKTVGHFKFAYVRFEILNMGMSQEEARITVRWRIKGLSGIRVMLKFWKYKLWRWQEIMNHQETWYDGVSYFDVGADGKIFQHIADKVMEDKDRSLDDKPSGGRGIPFAAKLGGALGATAFPTPSLSYNSSSSSNSSSDTGDSRGHRHGDGSSPETAEAAVMKSS